MPSVLKPPRALRMLAQHGKDALTSRFIAGNYIRPLVPKRIASKLRKRSLVEGTFGSFKLLDAENRPLGGWDPSWDTPCKMYFLRPHKGHIRDRSRQER